MCGAVGCVSTHDHHRYLPASDASDSCTDDVCTCDVNGESYEMQQGRATLDASSGDGFGMHLVNWWDNNALRVCIAVCKGGLRAAPTHSRCLAWRLCSPTRVCARSSMSSSGDEMTTADVEKQFTAKLGNMSTYDVRVNVVGRLYPVPLTPPCCTLHIRTHTNTRTTPELHGLQRGSIHH